MLIVGVLAAGLVLGYYLRAAWNFFEAEGDKKLILH